MWKTIKRILIGKSLASEAVKEERLNNIQALAIFGSDAVSSTAYATEEILLGLVMGGIALLSVSLPIAFAISALIFIVALSYREIVHAYPQGGGVYNVAKANLGETAGLLGASSLIIDYILTVAVSVAAGVAAITSAFPELFRYRVLLGIGVILFLMYMNLRGTRSSGRAFFLPPYLFIFSMVALIGYGLFRFLTGTLPTTPLPSEAGGIIEVLSLFIILKAFASGCAALTGIEAISNGIRVFRPPESHNAAKVLVRLAGLLAFIFLGVTFLAYQIGIVPKAEETILSQIAKTLFSGTPIYFLIQFSTFLILFLAANTPYADFPRVAALQARDGYWPKQFLAIGSKLVFSNGIIVLSVIAMILLAITGSSVHALIPVYAVGVFLGFSLSQLGMVFYWKEKGLRKHLNSLFINAIGFGATSIVFAVILYTKFLTGAWILLPIVFLLIIVMRRIKGHYLRVEKALEIQKASLFEIPSEKIMMVVLVSKLNRLSIESALFARGFHPGEIRALHIAFEKEEGEELKKDWQKRFPNISLDIFVDEYREMIPYILNYFAELEKEWKGKIVAVIPMVVPKNRLAEFLHNHTAKKIANAIRADKNNDAEIFENHIKVS